MIFQNFKDRTAAGMVLAKSLSAYAGKRDVLVLALPRGGVPVADALAKSLSVPMDVWLVRKLGVPEQGELALGAVSMGGICHVDANMVARLHIPKSIIHEIVARERLELLRRNRLYRGGRPAPDLKNKTVIVVDDGLATGATMHAAVLSLREARAHRIVAAVPVGAAASCSAIEDIADEFVCAHRLEAFFGVSEWYQDFSQVSDDEVLEILNAKKEARA